MWFLLLPFLILCALASVGGMAAASVVRRRRLGPRGELAAYGLLLALSLLPTFWHYQWVLDYASSYGAYRPDEPVGFYPGLKRFAAAVPAGAAMLWGAAILAARRLPLLGAGLPGAAFVLYFQALGWAAEDPPGVMLDNKPTILLFILDSAAVAGLATYALATWGWRPRRDQT